ncbi:MAG: peptidoglycan editing factor PgeF [Culicoidibacterales bacterium]
MLHVEKEMFVKEGDILKIKEWENDYGVIAGFTTKNGGVSPAPYASLNLSYTVGDVATNVHENRKKLADMVGIPLEKWIFANQQHTKNIAEVTQSDCGKGVESAESGIENVDGLYTKDKGIVLAAFFADCTPIFFTAPGHNLIGIVHAGWQGTVSAISRNFVKKWLALGVKAKEINVIIGPCASQSAYIVGEDIVKQVVEMELLDAREVLIDLGEGKYKMDTAYLNYLELVDMDIPEENIIISSYCTINDSDLFFSYRRDNQTGRMLGYITQK